MTEKALERQPVAVVLTMIFLGSLLVHLAATCAGASEASVYSRCEKAVSFGRVSGATQGVARSWWSQ